MSTTHIKPTLGRIVWYRGDDGEFRAAIITRVNGDFNVNLYVFPLGFTDADSCTKETVTHADPSAEPACFPSWHWMPYQVEQAKKAEEKLEAMSAGAGSAGGRLGSLGGFNPQHARFDALSIALRTPGVSGYHEALAAAAAYQAYIAVAPAPTIETKTYADGTTFTGVPPLPETSPTASGMSFGGALAALKAGQRVARAGWNGKGMFVYLVPAASYPVQTGAAKEHFGEGSMVPYNAYLALKGVDDTVSTWAPSGSDALAEDWLIA